MEKALKLSIWLLLSAFLLMSLAACSPKNPATCPEATPVGLADASEIASDTNLPFQFPLEESSIDNYRYFGWFGVSNECPPGIADCYHFPEVKYHAAEDYKRPAGTPVYAMADGKISFSGEAKGYGWLILIDHPQANLYSLYGHLSPSRWSLGNGTEVKRGDLIGYLGDSWENGGTREQPVDTHLHFGVRAGQVEDYPGAGEWRDNGGWLRICPQDAGWLQPSAIITRQEIPEGGYPLPEGSFLNRRGFELLYTGFFILGGGLMLWLNRKNKNRFLLFFPGIFITAAWVFLHFNGLAKTNLILGVGVAALAIAVYLFIKKPVYQGQDPAEIPG